MKFVHPVHRATHRIAIYLADLPNNPVTQGEAHILVLLAPTGRATVAELHRGLAHKRSTLTSILDRLEARRLVQRTIGKTDRRTFVIKLTRKGAALARRIVRHLDRLERAVSARVTSGDVKGFSEVIAALERAARPAAPRRPPR